MYQRSVRFARYGVTHICHLLDNGGRVMSWMAFKGIGGRGGAPVPCTRAEYEALRSSLPSAWLEVLDNAATSRQQGENLRDAVRKSPLPANAWVTAVGAGQKYVVNCKAGTDTVYEWLVGGELRPAKANPQMTAARLRTQASGWTEVAVWEDGGQSAASVRTTKGRMG